MAKPFRFPVSQQALVEQYRHLWLGQASEDQLERLELYETERDRAIEDYVSANCGAVELGTSVVPEQVYGLAPIVGTTGLASDSGHRHGTPVLGGTVQVQTSFGLTSQIGATGAASDAGHRHGTPGLSGTVQDETTFGLSPVVGASGTAADGFHRHGTPLHGPDQHPTPGACIFDPGDPSFSSGFEQPIPFTSTRHDNASVFGFSNHFVGSGTLIIRISGHYLIWVAGTWEPIPAGVGAVMSIHAVAGGAVVVDDHRDVYNPSWNARTSHYGSTVRYLPAGTAVTATAIQQKSGGGSHTLTGSQYPVELGIHFVGDLS